MPVRLPSRPLTTEEQAHLATFHKHLLRSRTILAVVGAGLSASSGLPTFRGAGGLWRNYASIDLATPEAFLADPGLVWQFYSSRRYQALKVRPNKGHFALAELGRRMEDNGKKFMMLTQNVDGLDIRAGHDPKTCLELHGSLFTLKCTSFACTYVEKGNREHPLVKALKGKEDEFIVQKGRKRVRDEEQEESMKKVKPDTTNQEEEGRKCDSEATSDLEDTKSKIQDNVDNHSTETVDEGGSSPEYKPVEHIPEDELPHCPRCKSGLLRPGVVWFGESLPLDVIDKADQFLVDNKVDLCLVIGTSGTVWPAMGYVERVKGTGKVAVFNMDEKDIEMTKERGGWGFAGDAAEWLPLALEPLIGSDFLPRNWKRL